MAAASQVALARDELQLVIADVWQEVQQLSKTDSTKNKASLYFDPANNAVWLKVPKGSAVASATARLGLLHPTDRNGKVCAASIVAKFHMA